MKTVVFVCVHNSGRSQMAEAFFNQMVNVEADAISGAAQPTKKLNPLVAEAMQKAGFETVACYNKKHTREALRGFYGGLA